MLNDDEMTSLKEVALNSSVVSGRYGGSPFGLFVFVFVFFFFLFLFSYLNIFIKKECDNIFYFFCKKI